MKLAERTWRSPELCVLGSGSAGNCSLLRLEDRAVLIDAGFGPRATAKRLADSNVDVSAVRAILLTHLDTDHFKATWLRTVRKEGIVIHCHRRHLHDLYRVIDGQAGPGEARLLRQQGLIEVFEDAPFTLTVDDQPLARVHPIPLAHDNEGTFGYRIEAGEHRIGYATDLGRVPDTLIEAFLDVHLLAIECNYDPQMQAMSDRPWMLKQRIMGGRGHLSNEQTFEAVRTIFSRSQVLPEHVVLLHLSRQCNDPSLVRHLFGRHPQIAERLCITCQQKPSTWLRLTSAAPTPERPRQMTMFS